MLFKEKGSPKTSWAASKAEISTHSLERAKYLKIPFLYENFDWAPAPPPSQRVFSCCPVTGLSSGERIWPLIPPVLTGSLLCPYRFLPEEGSNHILLIPPSHSESKVTFEAWLWCSLPNFHTEIASHRGADVTLKAVTKSSCQVYQWCHQSRQGHAPDNKSDPLLDSNF